MLSVPSCGRRNRLRKRLESGLTSTASVPKPTRDTCRPAYEILLGSSLLRDLWMLSFLTQMFFSSFLAA